MNTFRDVGEEALFFRRQQITKYTHVYSITLQVQNSYTNTADGDYINVEPILQIMEDADFHITHMTGSVTDPCNSDGTRYVTSTSSAIGLIFPMAGSENRGDRGIWFKFLDPKINRNLQLGIPANNSVIQAAQYLTGFDHTMIEFNSVFGPGYGHSWGKPIKFDYTLLRNERLKILIQNRQRNPDEEGTTYSRVSMAFIGHRYEN